ncbi:MAG: release factor glutamine methyltransferase [Flavobacteriales bacterium]|jgi:release factor glutamine methyltransferase
MDSLTIAQLLRRASELKDVSDSARLDTELILARVMACERSYFYTWPEKLVSELHSVEFNHLFERRLKGEPVAYILGRQGFWTLELEVSPCTLIPRADTEILIELVLSQLALPKTPDILDLGTGTGAIALALASEFPISNVLGVDVEVKAVELAQRNAKLNGIGNVSFKVSDWFSSIELKYDLIVSNPPYIDINDEHLACGDVRFEPASALVAKNGGLADIQVLVSGALNYMNDAAWLVVEHGWTQGEAVRRVFEEFAYSDVATQQDYAGHDRVTYGRIKRSTSTLQSPPL